MMKAYDLETYSMGTNILQRVYGDNGEEALKLAVEELERLEKLLSFYRPSSEISLINQRAGMDYTTLSAEAFYIIKKAKEYSKLSSGAFDITMAPVIELWGIFTKKQRVPNRDEISRAKALVDYKDILIDEGASAVMLKSEGQKIDLGGIAKGFAADKVLKIYKDKGIKSAFINLGGNVLVLGDKPGGTKWSIGIQNPFEPRGVCIGAVAVTDKTVVTSGDYVRYFEKDGMRYHHILDPRTGCPSASEVMSVTVICDTSIDADALSTAVFILGLHDGLKLIEGLSFADAIIITKDKKVYATKGIEESFTFAGEEGGFEYAAI